MIQFDFGLLISHFVSIFFKSKLIVMFVFSRTLAHNKFQPFFKNNKFVQVKNTILYKACGGEGLRKGRDFKNNNTSPFLVSMQDM